MLETGAFFNEEFYLNLNSDVAEAKGKGFFTSGFDHFSEFGKFESRNPGAFFDQSWYLLQNLDVANAVAAGIFKSAFDHFVLCGQKEGRTPNFVFENNYYLGANSDVAEAVNRDELTGIEHFIKYGVEEGRISSLGFDVRYYLENHADLKAAGLNYKQAFQHFVTYGLQEGRVGSQFFDVRYYLENNADLKAAKFNYKQAFQHFFAQGWQEKRPAFLPDALIGKPTVTSPLTPSTDEITLPPLTLPIDETTATPVTSPIDEITAPAITLPIDEITAPTVTSPTDEATAPSIILPTDGDKLNPTVTPIKTLSGLEEEPTPPLDLPENAGGGNSQKNPAPKHLKFSTTQEEYYKNTSVRLKDAWVFDASGASDLDKVEFSLHKIGDTKEDIQTATQFNTYSKDDRWGWFNYSINGLTPGKYQLKGIAYDKDGGKSNTAVTQFTVSTQENPQGGDFKPGELLVKFKSDVTDTQVESVAQAVGALGVENLVPPDPESDSSLEQWRVVKFDPATDLHKAQINFAENASVEVVEVNYRLYFNGIPNDSNFNQLWGLNNTGQTGGTPDADIDAPEAWDRQTGSKSVVVAVIDTGVDYNHQDLAANIWKNPSEIANNGIDDDGNGYTDDRYGFDFGNNDSDPMEEWTLEDNNPQTRGYGHGTHVAGTIGAVGNNNLGVVGVNPNVSLMSLKIRGSMGGLTGDAAAAINYAVKMGAKVINASFGYYANNYSSFMFDAISEANKAGVLFVAAAGNQSNNNDINPHWPANDDLPNVISVAATDHNDNLASFSVGGSNYGATTVDLGAPGKNIGSTIPGNQYAFFEGTSMAAPHVAGAAALLLAENPNLTPVELKNILMTTTDPLASLQGKTVSGGRLNLHKAIQAVNNGGAGNDRVIDLIRQERGSWVNGINDAEIFHSKGDWTFNQRIQLPNMDAMNGNFVNLIVGDFDGNGISDFIRQEKGEWVNGINDAQVYLGTGNGTFKNPIQMTDMDAMNGNLVNLIAGDFNGDKYTDIIRQEKDAWVNGIRDVEIYLSNGNGTFKNPILMDNADVMNGNVVNLIVGDFTGGGADDIIRQEKGNWVNGINDVEFRTFFNGNFIKVNDVPDMEAMNGDFVNLVAGDFNGDRITDLIRQEKGSRIDGIRDAEIYISDGNWGFRYRTVMDNASAMNGDNVNLIVGDLTGGGTDDIIRQEKNDWIDGVNDVEFLTYSNDNFVKVKDAPNMSDLNGNYVTLIPGLFA